jgi:polar amino acid transport system permease protein
MSATLELLLAWTPYLLEGFARNVGIATLATLLGTVAGAALALLRLADVRGVSWLARPVTSFFQNVPTLVLMFYLATLLPQQLALPFGLGTLAVPPWLKAALGLAGSPLGFTAWNAHSAVLAWRRGDRRTALLFVPNWLGGFLITLVASSTASLLGVDELIGRCNTVIKATSAEALVPVYLYACACFLVVGSLAHAALGRLKHALLRRHA